MVSRKSSHAQQVSGKLGYLQIGILHQNRYIHTHDFFSLGPLGINVD